MNSMSRTSARLAAIAPSATLAVDSKAKAMKAAGENVIGFGAGEPDFPTPQHIVDAAAAACADPKNHKYSPAGGLPDLKQAICDKTMRDSGFSCAPANVLVTNGGKHAVYTAFAALCDPGDEVICPAPYWTTYPEAITLAGGVPVVIDTDAESGFQVTVEQLDAAKTDKTKVLLFVSPDNPSGAVYPPESVKEIGEWAVANGVWVITDEIYEHLTYGSHDFSSMPVLVPELAQQLHHRQWRGEDLCNDGVACRLDDWPDRRHQGGDQLSKPCDLERLQRCAARHDRSGVGTAGRCGDDAQSVRPACGNDARHAQCHRRCHLPRAAGRLLLLPRHDRSARPRHPIFRWNGQNRDDDHRTGRHHLGRCQGGVRSR